NLLFETPPQVELAKLVNTLKTVSSRLIRKKHSEYLKEYYWKPVFWSRSYCILTTGGATIEMIEKYIRSQAGVKD
ncbi:IS200/IS605 family transposase, partial [Vallitalea longa]|uniref:IS200/IS605 family transposase n=1 Tax=Vallitalea longa TaxID=2936439 RepID=UPI002493474C